MEALNRRTMPVTKDLESLYHALRALTQANQMERICTEPAVQQAKDKALSQAEQILGQFRVI